MLAIFFLLTWNCFFKKNFVKTELIWNKEKKERKERELWYGGRKTKKGTKRNIYCLVLGKIRPYCCRSINLQFFFFWYQNSLCIFVSIDIHNGFAHERSLNNDSLEKSGLKLQIQKSYHCATSVHVKQFLIINQEHWWIELAELWTEFE